MPPPPRTPRRWQIKHADCLHALPKLDAESVDAVVTDPPYGVSINGVVWDRPSRLDPTRTPGRRRRAHTNPNSAFRMFCARWASACLPVLKPGAHLAAFAAPRTAHLLACGLEEAGYELRDTLMWIQGNGFPGSWLHPGGRGTNLKPAYQPILLARKPLEGTLMQNLSKHGTGALHIDACRTDSKEQCREARASHLTRRASPHGRWPANLVLTHAQTCAPKVCGRGCPVEQLGDRSRLFYCPRAPRRERDAGCEQLPRRTIQTFKVDTDYERKAREHPVANIHPTVKPIPLMRWVVRLLTPPGGLILDPFTGSGSTGAAAVLEGARFLGIERESAYVPIARARVKHWARSTPRHGEG